MALDKTKNRTVRLNRDLILDSALNLAATPGVVEFTFRALGRELCVDHTAFYRYFPNKEALISALSGRLLEHIRHELPEDPALSWREWLHKVAVTFHDVFLAHPSLAAQALTQRDAGETQVLLVDGIIAAISAAGLSGPSLMKHYGAYSSLVIASTFMAAHEQLALADTADDSTWFPTSEPMTALSHPHLFPLWGGVSELSFRDTFIAGLTVVLDSIEAAARQRE